MMDQCTCKGIRKCIRCDNSKRWESVSSKLSPQKVNKNYVFCYKCGNLAWKGWNVAEVLNSHPHHQMEDNIIFHGAKVLDSFISEKEEDDLLKFIDHGLWVESQSGRKKQDYGPKVNFKKKKIKMGNFNGFPEYSGSLLEKLSNVKLLGNFRPIELCNLDYDSDRGSSIDPHTDDSWLWGNRLVTINLLSDSVLTLSYPRIKPNANDFILKAEEKCKFCLQEKQTHSENCAINSMLKIDELTKNVPKEELCNENLQIIVRVPMNARSCIVLFDEPRYLWDHSILREDINGRRIAITFRELTPLFLEGGELENIGKELLNKSLNCL